MNIHPDQEKLTLNITKKKKTEEKKTTTEFKSVFKHRS